MVKVGDRVRRIVGDPELLGEYTVLEVHDGTTEAQQLMKKIFGWNYANAITVRHPKYDLSDVFSNEYEVITE